MYHFDSLSSYDVPTYKVVFQSLPKDNLRHYFYTDIHSYIGIHMIHLCFYIYYCSVGTKSTNFHLHIRRYQCTHPSISKLIKLVLWSTENCLLKARWNLPWSLLDTLRYNFFHHLLIKRAILDCSCTHNHLNVYLICSLLKIRYLNHKLTIDIGALRIGWARVYI